MAKHKGRRPTPPLDPAAVLGGRADASAAELLVLIQRVNPTGLDLPAAETARRYALKSRLQSLLVRRFPAEVRVEPHPQKDGVVLLGGAGPASHARVDELDEDVRAWLRRRLDEAAHEAPAAAPEVGRRTPRPRAPTEPRTVEDLLRAGQAARAGYDYEAACAHLQRALTLSAGASVAAALALLEVWVEDLAADAEALALSDQLPAETMGAPLVRLLLGIAAARSGERGRAAALIKGLAHPRVGEVLLLQAEAALRELALGDATALLEEARAAGAAGPELLRLTEELYRRRAAERAEREEGIRRALLAGDEAVAEAEARAVLARWPESEIAGRALRELRVRSHAREAVGLLGRAEAALREGRPTSARGHLAQALSLSISGDLRESLARCLQEAQAAEQEQRDAEQVEQALRLLADADTLTTGLRGYGELTERLRAQVRARSARAELLGWLEELGAARGSRGAAEAVLALAQARGLADPESILALLADHDKLLAGVPAAQALRHEALRAREERQREQALLALQEAEAAAEAGEHERALRLLAGAELRALREEEQARAQALRHRAEGLLMRRGDEATYHELHRANTLASLFQARRLAEVRAQRGQDAAEREHWRGSLLVTQTVLRARFAVRSFRSSTGEVIQEGTTEIDSPGVVLLPGGEEAVLLHSTGLWHFVRIVNVHSGAVRERFSVTSPRPLEPASIIVDNGSLWLVGPAGALEIQLVDQAITRWLSFDMPATDAPIESATMALGSRYLWFLGQLSLYTQRRSIVVYDVNHQQVVRTFAETMKAQPIPGVRLLATTRHGRLLLYDTRGTLVHRYNLATLDRLMVVCQHPAGDRLLALIGGSAGTALRYVAIDLRQPEAALPVTLPGLDPQRIYTGAVSLDLRLVFLICWRDAGKELVALRIGDSGDLEVTYRVAIPQFSHFLTNPSARRVVLHTLYEDGVRLVPLTDQPPQLGDAFLPFVDNLPLIKGGLTCSWHEVGRGDPEDLWGGAGARTPLEQQQCLRAFGQRALADADRCADFLYMLSHRREEALYVDLLAQARDRFPEHTRLRIVHAEALAGALKWAELRELLEGRDLQALAPGAQDEALHGYHLLGMALMGTDDLVEARRVLWEAHRWRQGKCRIENLLLMLDAPDPARANGWLEVYRAQVQRGDACAARGDLAGALAAYDHTVIWRTVDLQGHARLVDAMLRCQEAGVVVDEFRLALAAASFLHMRNTAQPSSRRELWMPSGVAWDGAQQHELEGRARIFLHQYNTAEARALHALLHPATAAAP